MLTQKDIIELYRYLPEERQLFAYIDAYESEIEQWLRKNRLDEEQRLRYMLAGLFLEYQATNHQGESFTTRPEKWQRIEQRQRTRDKLQTLNEHLGAPLESTDAYLQRLGVESASDFARLFEGGLFGFVVHGKY